MEHGSKETRIPLPFARGGSGWGRTSQGHVTYQKGGLFLSKPKKGTSKKMTPAEGKLWYHLRDKRFEGLKFRRQHGIGPYIVDYYCPEGNLVIEIDGDVHVYDGKIQRDLLREKYLRKRGLQVIRYKNQEILKNLDGVLENLRKRLLLPRSTSP